MSDPQTTPAKTGVLHAAIGGMHCGNCIFAVERRLKTLPGILDVRVKYPPGLATITFEDELNVAALEKALQADGYTIKVVGQGESAPRQSGRHYLEIAAAFAILIGLALALQHFHLLPRGSASAIR